MHIGAGELREREGRLARFHLTKHLGKTTVSLPTLCSANVLVCNAGMLGKFRANEVRTAEVSIWRGHVGYLFVCVCVGWVHDYPPPPVRPD